MPKEKESKQRNTIAITTTTTTTIRNGKETGKVKNVKHKGNAFNSVTNWIGV